MLSVVIPTLNADQRLAACFSALVPAMVDGLIREVIVVDGGSTDGTLAIVEAAGATLVRGDATGRGAQFKAGAKAARHPWLLFLHADTVLADGWIDEVHGFIDRIASGARPPAAAAFRFALDDDRLAARCIEVGVRLRCALFKLPYGDQGLLIPRSLYDAVGGYSDLPLMEDVQFVQRLSFRQRVNFVTAAKTGAERYRRDGYMRRVLRNLTCLSLYAMRVPMPVIQRWYFRR